MNGTGGSLTPDDLSGSRLESPALLVDWWHGYPVWQGQRDAAVPMVIVVTIAAGLGLAGNLLVAGILCCSSRRPRTTTSFYLLHRAIADACVQICQPLVVLTLVTGQHPWACIFNPALMQFGMGASTVFLSGLALDSWLACTPVRFPLQLRWRVLRVLVTVAWLDGLVIFTLASLGIFRQGDMCLEGPLFLIHSHDAMFAFLLLVFLLPLMVLVVSMALLLKRMKVAGVLALMGGRGKKERNLTLVWRDSRDTGSLPWTAKVDTEQKPEKPQRTKHKESTRGQQSTETTEEPGGKRDTETIETRPPKPPKRVRIREPAEDIPNTALPTPRHMRLLVALTLVFAVTHFPYWALRIHYSRVPELLPFTVHAVVICLLLVGTALDPILAVWFRMELWQGVLSRLPSHPPAAVPLQEI